MKTIFVRIVCAALFMFGGVINSQADEAAPAGGDAATVSTVRAAAESWASAWSGKDVEAYLGHYAADFTPPENLSREAWAKQRRDRLSRPAHIQVELDWIGVTVNADGSADASFTQIYKSPTYSDKVTKTLTMVLENGQWKIRDERTGAVTAPKAVPAAAETAQAEAQKQAQAEQEARAASEAAAREAAAKEAAAKEAAMKEAAAQEAAMKEAAAREAAAQEAAMKEAAAREAAAQEAAMKEAVVQEPAMKEAAAQDAAMREAAEREAAMRAAAEEAARKAAAAYQAEQNAAEPKAASVLKEVKEKEAPPASAIKEAVAPKAAQIEPESNTWKIAGILLFLLLAPAVAYGTMGRPRQISAA